MNHIQHISQNKTNLELRWKALRAIREYFWGEGLTEVETPIFLQYSGQDPYLESVQVSLHNNKKEVYNGYLHTSPEYTMKKMLAAGYANIFSLCKCFRDYESFGGAHNPEFTMLEWYRTGVDFVSIMKDVEDLCGYVQNRLKIQKSMHFIRIHMRNLWKDTVGVDLDKYLDQKSMYELCKSRGYTVREDEKYENLFYTIFLNEIEPRLKDMGNVIVHHYPAQMAALSRISEDDARYAERFEVYMMGMEIANAFSELTDGVEQKKRFLEEYKLRKDMGKSVIRIDEDFIEAVDMLPECAGIALGVDRLVQVLLDCKNIDNVLPLPMSKLIK